MYKSITMMRAKANGFKGVLKPKGLDTSHMLSLMDMKVFLMV